MRSELGYRVKGDGDNDQQRAAPEVEWDAVLPDEELRDHADQGEIDAPDERQSPEDISEMGDSGLTGPVAGNRPSIVLQPLGHFRRPYVSCSAARSTPGSGMHVPCR